MNRLFSNARSFQGDVSKWDVSNVKDMSGMFQGATLFNGDISQWEVSSVINMEHMFRNAASFKQNLCGVRWVHSMASKKDMFVGSPGSISSEVCRPVLGMSLPQQRNFVSRKDLKSAVDNYKCEKPLADLRLQHAIGCVVTAPWEENSSPSTKSDTLTVLINPANEALIGTSRPYFPRGGPVPPRPPPGLMASSAGWGGMDAGTAMLYPAQTVDGLVHMHGGVELRAELQSKPVLERRGDGDHVRCRVGDSILTHAPHSLPFDLIAHTPPPFWSMHATDPIQYEKLLGNCFTSALNASMAAAADKAVTSLVLATPILGAGARGAPTTVAARALMGALARYRATLPVVLPPPLVEVVVRVVAGDVEGERALRGAMEMEDG